MKILDWNRLNLAERRQALERPDQRSNIALQEAVRAIVGRVREGGWDALVAEAIRIDGEPPRLEPVAAAAAEARHKLEPAQVEAIELAARNITLFHERSRPAEQEVETLPGMIVRKVWRPIERVGLYVPGGRTPLFSSLLMLALPAQAAGVEAIVVVTPPRPEGGLDPAVALAAQLCGIEGIWTVGGAQAIAALAFGAGDIPAVHKICGPGNSWVAEAKTYVASLSGGPAIDLPAGPSELLVIADEGSDPAIVASDLLSQAEHDAAAQVLLVTDCEILAAEVAREVLAQAKLLPRAETIKAALMNARIILTTDVDQALEVANAYAPEHLSLALPYADRLVPRIRSAGAVFAGSDAAEAFGDYLAGSSHVLPTDGAARAWSGVSVYTFLKSMSVQTLTREAAGRVAGPAAMLARLEGLEAHARAAEARRERVPA
ncbi:MAG: histidinol dehydrogenase [Sphingosinicella sp.]|nr:histidinol dehydrogenase [Sphingosinicella sp.]